MRATALELRADLVDRVVLFAEIDGQAPSGGLLRLRAWTMLRLEEEGGVGITTELMA